MILCHKNRFFLLSARISYHVCYLLFYPHLVIIQFILR
jgi:hypothetical protein